MNRFKRLLAALIVICMVVIGAPAISEETRYVAATWTRVYKKASYSSGRLGKLSFGESVTFVQKKNGWIKLKSATGAVGFVKTGTLSKKNPNTTQDTYYALKGGTVIYRHALTSSKKLATVAKGTAMTVIATSRDGKWRRVNYDGKTGYVMSSKISKTMPEMPTVVYIGANTTFVYKSNSEASGKMAVMSYGESLVRRKVKGNWAKVKTSAGVIGWVKNADLTTTDPNGDEVIWYATKNAPVRVYCDTSADQLGSFTKDEQVPVVASTPDGVWKRVKFGSGYGYVKTDRLSDTPPGNRPVYNDPYKGTAGPIIERVCAIAVAQYGKPYVWGTEGPDTYDCSGLTYYAFQKGAGVTLQRSAYAQGYDPKYEKITDVNQLKRGDIVCFNTVDSDQDLSDHTSLYLGGGLFIHASSGKMEVTVSTLSEGYYSRVFSWALRIVNE